MHVFEPATRAPRRLCLVATAVIAAAIAALAAGGCRRRTTPAPAPAALEVEVSGCATLRRGPLCELAPAPEGRRLRLWVALQPAQAALYAFDGGAYASLPEVRRVAGGVVVALEVPPGKTSLHVEARGGGQRARFRLALATSAGRPAALSESERLAKQGQLEQATTVARAALVKATGDDVGPLRGRLGRLAMARGDAGAAALELRAAQAQAQAAGRLSSALDDGLALAFVLLVMQEKLGEAAPLLAELRALADGLPLGTSDLRYFEGLLAERSGDQRRALALYREAVERAERLEQRGSEAVAREALATLLAWIGRGDEALASFRALIAAGGDLPACERALLKVNLAWTALVARWSDSGDETRAPDSDPRPLLADARQAVLADCEDPFRQRHAILNEALYALETGDEALARARQAELARLAGGRTAALGVWEAELGARLELAAHRGARALGLFQRQAQLARAAGFVEGVVRAETGQGRALLAMGKRRQAIGRFRAADARLAGLVAAIPLGEGRDSFAHARQSSARQLVSALVEAGEVADAARAARTARARALRVAAQTGRLDALTPADRARYLAALGRYRTIRSAIEDEAAGDWKLSAAELGAARARRARQDQAARLALDDAYRVVRVGAQAPVSAARPAPGALDLVYFPGEPVRRSAPAGGAAGASSPAPVFEDPWWGFALTAGGARVVRLGSLPLRAPPARLAAALIEPFAAELRAARRLRVLAYGAVEAIDLHALPLDGQPLLEKLPIEYGLDIATRPAPAAHADGVLVVANPAGDLPSSEKEGQLVAGLSRARTVLAGAQAERARVVSLLSRVRLFHYAGHGDFAGPDGIDSSLRLHADGRLSVGDILALPAVPTLVVISACEAARTQAQSTGAVGVAQAFLLAGSGAAVAPIRPVRDTLAYTVVTEFYREGWPRAASTVAEALRQAQLAARRRMPEEDWSSFRALSP